MAKVAVITDSNSGITQEEAKKAGIFVLPMPFTINGKEYFEGLTLTQDEFYKKLEEGVDIFTSQPTPSAVCDLWDEVLKEYDEIVHIPMSSGLSSSCQTALMLADDYDGKIYVVDNGRISVTQRDSVYDALKLAKQGKTGKEIKNYLMNERANQTIYITLDTLTYLKKGGRITPAAAALGTLLRIKPVLQIQGDKLDQFSKARTMSSAKKEMLNAAIKDIEGRISEGGKYPVNLSVVSAHDENAAIQYRDEIFDEIHEKFPFIENIEIGELSLSVSCHIGPGALALAASRVVK